MPHLLLLDDVLHQTEAEIRRDLANALRPGLRLRELEKALHWIRTQPEWSDKILRELAR